MGPIYQTASRRTPPNGSSTKPFSVFKLRSLQYITFDQSMAAAFTSQHYQLVFFGVLVSRKSKVTVNNRNPYYNPHINTYNDSLMCPRPVEKLAALRLEDCSSEEEASRPNLGRTQSPFQTLLGFHSPVIKRP
jgi:hypothetical protein